MSAMPTLNATTAEGGLLELIEHLGDLQAVSALTDTPKTVINSHVRDGVTGQIDLSLTLPSTSTTPVEGKPVITVTPVFP